MKYRCEIKHATMPNQLRVWVLQHERPANPDGWHATLTDARREVAGLLRSYAAECQRQADEMFPERVDR